MTTPRDAIGLSERLLAEIGQPVIYRNDAVLREAATTIAALQARVKELEGKLSTSEAGHQRLFDKYQSALKDGASNPPTREAIAAALRETAYKYFGDYELSPSQWDAVHCLENAAKCFMAAESRATSAEQERDEAYERAAKVAEGLQCRNCNSVVPSGDGIGLCCGRPDYDSISDVPDAIRRLAGWSEKEGK